MFLANNYAAAFSAVLMAAESSFRTSLIMPFSIAAFEIVLLTEFLSELT